MKKYLKRQSNAPGNDTIPQNKSDELIKKYNPDLFNKDKWVRFKMTGEGQGVTCRYAFYIKEGNIHYYYIEQHAFQTSGKQDKNTQYRNLFLHCEIDENNNIIGNIELKPGSDEFPIVASKSLRNTFSISDSIEAIICTDNLQQTILDAKKSLGA